jgi:hypothetical protein
VRPATLSRRERKAFEELALILDLIPDLPRWTREERASVVAIIRAKAVGLERRYLSLMQGHTRLREAVISLGSRPPRDI